LKTAKLIHLRKEESTKFVVTTNRGIMLAGSILCVCVCVCVCLGDCRVVLRLNVYQ